MKEKSILPRRKSDYNDLETFLKTHNLLDERAIWFAGYDDSAKTTRNAITANLFYGKRSLQIVSVNKDMVYLLKNSKKGFKLYEFGKVSDSYNIRTWHNIIWPSIKIESNENKIHIKATKNKKQVFILKNLLK
ncbi:MAG: hypothetical protein ACOCV1_07750 [Bacillota bacterium]